MGKKYVYYFGGGGAEGKAQMRDLLGGKGANLGEMCNLGIPVPPGFTISTEACLEYLNGNGRLPGGLWEEVQANMAKVEAEMGSRFGDPENPLLFSVRSGARASMPGMMDTVLNIGLNDRTVKGLAKKSDNARFTYDAYRRFVTMFSNVVLGLEHSLFESILDKKKEELRASFDTDLDADALKSLVALFKELVAERTGKPFPEDPMEQLRMGVLAVFDSWNVPRAVEYRRIYGLPDDWGTAVNVQSMVFGNMGENSGSGVVFTRNPATGEKKLYGEFLINAQGEDVVAGIRTPMGIDKLEELMPDVYKMILRFGNTLETHFKDVQDMEFTVQEGKLYMLQTRTGARTAAAAVKIAVDMVNEGLIDKRKAVGRVEPAQVNHLLFPTIDPNSKCEVVAKGLAASPGAAVGKVVFSPEKAERLAARKEKVILVRTETSAEDIGGMNAAEGILTTRGGITSHAAVVARGMGRCCVTGCEEIKVYEERGEFIARGKVVKEGDYITINGTTGEVMLGKADLVRPELSGNFAALMKWADEIRVLKVRANADNPYDSHVARDFGAEGIGLCRTEHMFFGERIKAMREMILSDTTEGRRKALEKLLPMQRGDFKEIFRVMQGLPITIRLLDPPLHEFLPHGKPELEELASEMGKSLEEVQAKVETLKEVNPMLGLRGCRLGITYPEIYEMQARAIFEAACELKAEGSTVTPEVMIPLVGHVSELKFTKGLINKAAAEVMAERQMRIEYLVGTMIEIPRAALTADEVAGEAEFFSFGTNDLTQMVFGLSRDDAGKFLPNYLEKGFLEHDPFVTIDRDGVGRLMRIGVEKGRKARKDLKIGICGEHGGDPKSVELCYQLGLNYVSCSPYRVPVARLAAAHARLKDQGCGDLG